MKTRIVRIGNSQGIRIPKVLLERSGLGQEVDLQVQDEQIIIRPAQRPRQGWAELFREMAQQGHDRLIDKDFPGQTRWDKDEWQW